MLLAVIDRVNVLDHAERSLLVFTECLGWAIGNCTPNVDEAGDGDDDKSVVNNLYSPVPPASSKSAGVSLVEEGSADMIPGVDSPAIVDKGFQAHRSGYGWASSWPPSSSCFVWWCCLQYGIGWWSWNIQIEWIYWWTRSCVSQGRDGSLQCS